MADATILLISPDNELASQIEGVTASIPHLGFKNLIDLDLELNGGGSTGLSLVLIHQTDMASSQAAIQAERVINAGRQPVATIILAESYDPDEAIRYLQMGVTDYLGLPIESRRLTSLISSLTIGCRRSPTMVGSIGLQPSQDVRSASADFNLEPVQEISSGTVLGRGPSPADRILLDGNTLQVSTLVEQIRRVAPQSATILLGGETGTGKTRLARQIHELSDRRAEPFLVVNCENLIDPLVEGELFGYVRGAFAGACSDRTGKFAQVGRGTLFLDGVDALPLAVQAKLLRVVEDRAFEPIGATRTTPLQARLIAASNRPLHEEIAENRFRSDLYYRLNVVGFQLPPLRERRDAIASLANRFLFEFAAQEGRDFDPISETAMQALQEYDWPGNVRELRNVIARCVAICPHRSIHREDLPASVFNRIPRTITLSMGIHPIVAATFNRTTHGQVRGEIELSQVVDALEKHGNNRLRAANELGISRMTLYKKLYKYGLMQPGTTSKKP